MLFWASPDFYASRGINDNCLRTASDRDLSHDAIFHSLLPLFGIETSQYQEQLDLFATCRTAAEPRVSMVAHQPIVDSSTLAQGAKL